jgi:hypothetical protein
MIRLPNYGMSFYHGIVIKFRVGADMPTHTLDRITKATLRTDHCNVKTRTDSVHFETARVSWCDARFEQI